VFDRISFRKLGDDEASTRWRYRSDLKTAAQVADEKEGSDLPPVPKEAILEAVAQGAQANQEQAERLAAQAALIDERIAAGKGTEVYFQGGQKTVRPLR